MDKRNFDDLFEQIEDFTNRKGFVAALDQSGGSTPKALLNYGIEKEAYSVEGRIDEDKMFDLVHQMRQRVITNPVFNSTKILGTILFKKTLLSEIEGIPTSKYLLNKGIYPFLKVDLGLNDKENGVRLMKDIIDLDDSCKLANQNKVFGTKMRSLIEEYDETGISLVVSQQFEYARKILSYNLVPIVEPEVSICAENRGKIEEYLSNCIERELLKLSNYDRIILKLTIPVNSKIYSNLLKDNHLLRIVALSGGYSQAEACKNQLKVNYMIASFSRALLENLNFHQTDEEFSKVLENSIDKIYQASVNKESL